jgi:putative phosphoribosyl transferase
LKPRFSQARLNRIDFFLEESELLSVTFLSRDEAGHRLGEFLLGENVRPDLVLGLPRGGVVVAAQVAKLLRCPLGVLAVRKIGHPRHREYAVGALAEGGVVLLDEDALAQSKADPDSVQKVVAEEARRLDAAEKLFQTGIKPTLEGKSIMIVDDGLATGATAEAAVVSARKQIARQVIVAVPVASVSAAGRIEKVADRFYALVIDPGFAAVGQYYDSFPQVSDEVVLALLA